MRIHSTTTASSAARAKSLMQASALALCLAWPATANATLVTENFTFSGVEGSTAMATGWITFDPSDTPLAYGAWAFKDISMTVSGADFGNGIFHKADFQEKMYFATGGVTLDFSKELIGQMSGSNFWGFGGVGNFNLFNADGSNAPRGAGDFQLFTYAGDGTERMVLTSMTMSAVPEPGNLLALSGLVGSAAFLRVRRRGAGLASLV